MLGPHFHFIFDPILTSHLAGLDDTRPADAARIAREQTRILTAAQKSSA